jgi:hypothetical protein
MVMSKQAASLSLVVLDDYHQWNIIDCNVFGMVMRKHLFQFYLDGYKQARWPRNILLFLGNYHQWNIIDLNFFFLHSVEKASLTMFCYY